MPSAPPKAITTAKVAGRSQSACRTSCQAKNPAVTVASTWSRPPSGCAKPCTKPWPSPRPVWAQAALGTSVRATARARIGPGCMDGPRCRCVQNCTPRARSARPRLSLERASPSGRRAGPSANKSRPVRIGISGRAALIDAGGGWGRTATIAGVFVSGEFSDGGSDSLLLAVVLPDPGLLFRPRIRWSRPAANGFKGRKCAMVRRR